MRVLTRIAATAIGLWTLAPAHSAAAPFPPDQAEICIDAPGGKRIIDKAAFAKAILKKWPISALALSTKVSIPAGATDAAQQIMTVATPALCQGNDLCTDADKANLKSISNNLAIVTSNENIRFAAPPDLSDTDYFRGPNDQNAIECKLVRSADKKLEPPPRDKEEPSVLSALRVRGSVDDLYIDRSHENDFASASQATLSFADDGVKKTRTDTLTGVIGYNLSERIFPSLRNNGLGQRIDVIPYVQANRIILNTFAGSTATPNATETVDFGVTTDLFLVTPNGVDPWGHLLRIRPDYLYDLQDDSRIASLNLQYVPIVNTLVSMGDDGFGSLNSYRTLVSGVAFLKPIFDFRIDAGFYTDRGLPSVAADHVDYLRVGGQAGAAFLSAMKGLPLTFATTYTGLYGAVGPKNVGYFSNKLSLNLFNDYLTPSASYSNGTREDTAKREQLWQIGLSFRY
jgi:hypothetical protein